MIDLHLFVVAVQCLRETVERARDRLPEDRTPLDKALSEFNRAWPRLEELRNNQVHVLGPGKAPPLGIWYFRGEAVEGLPDGRAVTLASVEDMQPAIEKLHNDLIAFLPPVDLDEDYDDPYIPTYSGSPRCAVVSTNEFNRSRGRSRRH